jgi:hypothetical protein
MTRRLSAVAVLLALLPAGAAWAHGGEDHGNPASAAVTTPAKPGLSRSAVTDRFELVMTLDAPQAGAKQHVHLYLSDYATNAPVGGAKLGLDWGQQVTGEATATNQPGVYESEVLFPAAGDYSPLITVNAPGVDDLITLDPVPVPAAPAMPASKRSAWAVGVALVLVAGGAVWWRRRPQGDRTARKVEARP